MRETVCFNYITDRAWIASNEIGDDGVMKTKASELLRKLILPSLESFGLFRFLLARRHATYLLYE